MIRKLNKILSAASAVVLTMSCTAVLTAAAASAARQHADRQYRCQNPRCPLLHFHVEFLPIRYSHLSITHVQNLSMILKIILYPFLSFGQRKRAVPLSYRTALPLVTKYRLT